jgi:hypothetical protein
MDMPPQWQPQPDGGQQPPPPKDGPAPPLDFVAALKTDSWSVFFVLAHFGQAIFCVLLSTTRS